MKGTPAPRKIPLVVVCAGLLASCYQGEVGTLPASLLPEPRIDELGATSVAVGDELRFRGAGFISPELGSTEVTFRGVYRHHDGGEEPMSLTVEVAAVDEATLRWPSFGPFRIPFGRAGNVLGTFEGEVLATNVGRDGGRRRQSSELVQVSLEVEPSLVIRDLRAEGQTFEADCRSVSTHLINFVPYRLQVEAVGFEPEVYAYTVGAGLLVGGEGREEPTTVEHEATSPLDNLGVVEHLHFAEVPPSVAVYASSISVDVVSSDGAVYRRLIPVMVHQPLYVRYRGGVEVAEIMEPEPISSCMSGGQTGRDVTYSETTTDTRTISVSRTLTSGWTDSYTEQHTSTYGGSNSETNRISFTTTDAEHYSWNVHGEVIVGVEGGFGPFARAKAELRVGGGHEWGGSHSESSTTDESWTQMSTYSEAVSLAEQHQESISEAMSETWTVSSSSSESLNYRAFLIPSHFGVFYRQTTRLIRRADIVALDLCGNETVVGEFVLSDYTWAPDLAVGKDCPPLPVSTLP